MCVRESILNYGTLPMEISFRTDMEHRLIHSNLVSDVLDFIGLSSNEIKWRIRIWKHVNCISRLTSCMGYSKIPMFVTGSRAEGLGLSILGSDTDIMTSIETMRVINSPADWEVRPDMLTVYVDTVGVHSGYCRLKPMNNDEPTFTQDFDRMERVKILDGEIFLDNNRWKYGLIFPHSKSGPAETIHLNVDAGDFDKLTCFNAPWPPSAKEWLHRIRPSNYPPPDLIASTAKAGIHIVPTGHKASPYRDIEWRFSFSSAELYLVHRWPNTASKCYILLKLLKNEIGNEMPSLGKTLCSYHLKTLMFWIVEETGIKFWSEHSLVDCLLFALRRLLEWIENGYIPHYFFRDNNLFESETGTRKQMDLIRVLRKLVAEGYHCILQNASFRKWSRMNGMDLFEKQSVVAHRRSELQTFFARSIQLSLDDIIERVHSKNILDYLHNIDEILNKLSAMIINHDQDLSKTLCYMIDFLRGSCATRILSFIRHSHMSNLSCFAISRKIKQMLKESSNNRFVQTKLAIFYFQSGKYRRASELLQVLAGNINIKTMKICEFGVYFTSLEQTCTLASIESHFDAFSSIATEHYFLKSEIHATPLALRYDMFKTTRTPENFHQCLQRRRQDTAMVDPDVLVYYLQYLCYKQLGKDNHSDVAFDNLKWIVKDRCVLYRETALNLLGQCYLDRGDFRRATACFVKSLQIESDFTASLILLAVAIGRAMENKQ
ncbi:hypothetical protein ScPMuIL_016174 [Solemya velum]